MVHALGSMSERSCCEMNAFRLTAYLTIEISVHPATPEQMSYIHSLPPLQSAISEWDVSGGIWSAARLLLVLVTLVRSQSLAD
jgi:hypothetical protein